MDNDRNLVTSAQAARLLGKSEKTIRRWIETGKIPVSDMPSGRRVDISAHVQDVTGTVSRQDAAALTTQIEGLQEQVRTLQDKVRTLQADVQRLTEVNAQLVSERDYLRQAHEASLALLAQTQQKLLPAPRKRAWWRFWEREEPEGEG